MPVDPSKWDSLLSQIDASSGGGDVYYIKQPKTRLRLLLPSMSPNANGDDGDDDSNFYAETLKFYQGKQSTAFLVLATVIGTSDKNDQNVDPKKVRAIRLAKTAFRAIVAALAEGHELFDPEEGHGILLERIGGGNAERTSYNVQVSPKKVPINLDELQWPEKDLWEIAEAESTRSAERDAKKGREDAAADRQGPTRGSRNKPQTIDDDEDLPF